MTNSFEGAEGWVATNAYSNEYVSSCGGRRMIGGSGVFGALTSVTKIVPNLTPHHTMKLKL